MRSMKPNLANTHFPCRWEDVGRHVEGLGRKFWLFGVLEALIFKTTLVRFTPAASDGTNYTPRQASGTVG